MNKWHWIEEELPEIGKPVIGFYQDNHYNIVKLVYWDGELAWLNSTGYSDLYAYKHWSEFEPFSAKEFYDEHPEHVENNKSKVFSWTRD